MRKKIDEVVNGKRKIIKKPELLAPAGSLEKLKVAIMYGADAVFLGGKKFGLRSNAQNFSLAEIAEGVAFAKKYGAKIYITTNIIAHDEDLPGLDDYLQALASVGAAGIIVADPYIIQRAQAVAPELEIHVSTQQSILNWQTAQFFADNGAQRVVLAREATQNEIQEILDKTDVELEVFIHGAMCIAYSGRCTLSNHMTSRDSNRGGCCQSCRWEYDLMAQEPDGKKPVVEESMPQFSMSAKDLNLIARIPDLIEMGIDSLKIEGRMKSVHYIATVTSSYRKLIDMYCENPDGFTFDTQILAELQKAANRPTAESFFASFPDAAQQLFDTREEHPNQKFIGITLELDEKAQLLKLEQRNNFKVGDTIEFFGPYMENIRYVVPQMFNAQREPIAVANHPQEIIYIPFTQQLPKFTLIRKA